MYKFYKAVFFKFQKILLDMWLSRFQGNYFKAGQLPLTNYVGRNQFIDSFRLDKLEKKSIIVNC
ncbi:MAG: hypothetical protein DRP51_11260 [Candidatus Zixiibacteriota bacterium]|nr:MAG: hypothetical protein DRP51_11260 [candidate division Zixibacteria bacterium]